MRLRLWKGIISSQTDEMKQIFLGVGVHRKYFALWEAIKSKFLVYSHSTSQTDEINTQKEAKFCVFP